VGRCASKSCNILACLVTLYTVNRWLSIRFNLLSSVIVGLVAFVSILTPTIDAALAGFILAFAYSVTNDVSLVLVRHRTRH
jgi:membrane protein YdbS with pleckstrin-like domain